MKLLFDQNLSDRLLRILADDYPGSVHVRDVGLERADDEDVWRYAQDHGLAIASKDSDFHQRSLVRGHPPKVVWIRLGNCATDTIAESRPPVVARNRRPMRDFSYPVVLTADDVDGGYVVAFPDLPEAITQGDDASDALAQAADALEEAVAGRIRRGDELPEPSRPRRRQPLVPVPAQTAAKAALYLALRESGLSKTQLAERLGCDEKEVRRLLDPRHPSKLPRLQAALAALGKRLAIRLESEAA